MSNYYIFKIGLFLAKVLPRRASIAAVILLCDVHCFFSKQDRHAVENNLKIIQGCDKVSRAEVREVFRNFGIYLLEFFTMKERLNLKYIQEHVDVKNMQYLTQVFQKGKGGIVLSAHVGNWEMGAAALPLLGFPLSVVALAHRDGRVNALFNAQREAFGIQVIQTDVAVRRVVEHLQKNRLIAILADRDFGQRGLRVDFFGQKAMVPKGAAVFSLKMGVPIVPVFLTRVSKDRFEFNIHPPIEPPPLTEGRITDEIVVAYIQQYLKVIESAIRKDPSQWLLFKGLADL